MNSFKRVLGYIWPQWPRIIVVVVCAMVIAILLSLSFMTIIPLLKVMIGSEGLHGWVDRKTCDSYYGLEFAVPTSSELSGVDGMGPAGGLLVTKVQRKSLGQAAGLRPADRIVGVGAQQAQDIGPVPFSTLLERLAASKETTLTVRVQRLGDGKKLQEEVLELGTAGNSEALENLGWSSFAKTHWGAKVKLVRAAQWAVSFLPREQSRHNRVNAVVLIIVAMIVVTIIRCVAKFYQGYIAQKIVLTGITQLREDVFAHMTEMPVGAFASERPSDIVSRIVRDTSTMGQAIKIMLGKALREPMNALFMLLAAMILNWQLTLIFMGGAPFVLVLLGMFGKKMKKATRRSLMASSQMLSKLQETVAALRVVKVYNQQDHEQTAFKTINNSLFRQLLKISKVDAATHPVLEVLGLAAGSAALIVGVYWVTAGDMDGPEFLTLLVLLGASAEAIRKTSDIWNKIQQANAAAERVFEALDRPVESDRPGAIELPRLAERIEFRDVVFTYPGAPTPTLKGVNLTVEAGHNVAIVGPNGSGKTTLANLIPRFYDPDSGQILIDGADIRDVSRRSLRDQIAMVTQDIVTFNDTVAENIAYGKPNPGREQIVEAASRAFAHEFISRLPEGYETVIGEYGLGLSGGQLQRIVIARAILKNPAILIFDEATSQVDAESEAKIHQAIEEIMYDRTTFIIAHRFSTVIAADMIVVMDNGQVVAQGQHDDLMQACPLYQGLYETQLVKA